MRAIGPEDFLPDPKPTLFANIGNLCKAGLVLFVAAFVVIISVVGGYRLAMMVIDRVLG